MLALAVTSPTALAGEVHHVDCKDQVTCTATGAIRGDCFNQGRWTVEVAITAGAGYIYGEMKCGGQPVAVCAANGDAPKQDACVGNTGTGSGVCATTSEAYNRDFKATAKCLDPLDPTTFVVITYSYE